MQVAQFWSLVRELRSHMPHGGLNSKKLKKKKKESGEYSPVQYTLEFTVQDTCSLEEKLWPT